MTKRTQREGEVRERDLLCDISPRGESFTNEALKVPNLLYQHWYAVVEYFLGKASTAKKDSHLIKQTKICLPGG